MNIAGALVVAHVYAGICFVVGLVLLGLGAYRGFPSSDAKVQQAKAKVDTAKAQVVALTTQAVNAAQAPADDSSAAAVKATGDQASNLLNDLAGVLGDFPENLRFPVFLVVIGGALMSVAIVQFGGHSIF